MPEPGRPAVRRREFLAAAGGLVAAACSGAAPAPSPRGRTRPPAGRTPLVSPASIPPGGTPRQRRAQPATPATAPVILARSHVPVLCFHQVRDWAAGDSPSARAIITPPWRFAAQIGALAQAGYTAISPDQLLAYLEYGTGLPGRPVMLSFDDASESQYAHALPVLLAHRFTDPRNPRIGPARRHPASNLVGRSESTRLRPLAEPMAAPEGRPELVQQIQGQEPGPGRAGLRRDPRPGRGAPGRQPARRGAHGRDPFPVRRRPACHTASLNSTSRTSLLSGRLTCGGQADEQRGFQAAYTRAGVTGVLFHKQPLDSSAPGHELAADVAAAVDNVASTNLVACVLNTVDDDFSSTRCSRDSPRTSRSTSCHLP